MPVSKRALKRSYPCNKDLLVHLRERKGWTQLQFAQEAGYSERLINKAESGRSISTSAIEVLAEALSTGDDKIYFEDLICDTVALAKRYMAAIYIEQKNALAAIRDFLDDDVVFRIAGDPAIIPFAGEHRGIAGVGRALELFFSILEAPPNHDHTACYSYLAQGKNVVVWGDSWIRPIGLVIEKPVAMIHRMTFHRGKLVCFEDIFDTLAGAQMLRDASQLPDE